MVGRDASNRLDRVIIKLKHLFVENECLTSVVQHLVDTCDTYLELRVVQMLLQGVLEKFNRSDWLILLHRNFDKLDLSGDHRFILERG